MIYLIDMQIVYLIVGISIGVGVLFSVVLMNDVLIKFGEIYWQYIFEMKWNGFFGKFGYGFVFGKMGKFKSCKFFVMFKVFFYVLIVVLIGCGKMMGFVILNFLIYQGSVVVLDVKGENFEVMVCYRIVQGDKVFCFVFIDWKDGCLYFYNFLL